MTAQGAPSVPATASEQRAAVIVALVANVAVALAKLGAFAFTGSSAMLAESLHSAADSSNEVLLLVGARRSSRPADERHPLGHTRYRYLYAYVVSLAVFWIGGVLAVIEGISHLVEHESIADPRPAFAVLVVAAALDGWSLRTTVRTGRSAKGALSWKQLVRATKAPDLIVVFLEDLGALIGIGIALIGIALSTATGNGIWDAIASIAIGILLMSIGSVVNRETQSLLLGESATPAIVTAIRAAIENSPEVETAVDLRTIHLGPDDLVVAAGVVIDPDLNAAAIATSIAAIKVRVRDAAPFRMLIYLEPRLRAPAPTQGAAEDPHG